MKDSGDSLPHEDDIVLNFPNPRLQRGCDGMWEWLSEIGGRATANGIRGSWAHRRNVGMAKVSEEPLLGFLGVQGWQGKENTFSDLQDSLNKVELVHLGLFPIWTTLQEFKGSAEAEQGPVMEEDTVTLRWNCCKEKLSSYVGCWDLTCLISSVEVQQADEEIRA